MSRPGSPTASLFFAGFIWNQEKVLGECLLQCERLWGDLLARSGDFNFTETTYYQTEMGDGLKRTFGLFGTPLSDTTYLVDRKYEAARLEDAFQVTGKRSVNIDPGYLNGHQVVIATFKDYAHRIHLGRGVFAHLEYLFKHGETVVLPWTYPDLRNKEHRALFQAWRARYLHRIAFQDK